jgi:xanthine phosphoribosyltransferase
VENCHQAEAHSRTKGGVVCLRISENYLRAGENVVIIDDFLATGQTILALAKIVNDAGARLCGICCVIEKPVEGGRQCLQALDVPVVTPARVEWRGADLYVR